MKGLTTGVAVFCLGLIACQLRADTLDVWSLRNPQINTSPTLGTHTTIDYLDGRFVAWGGSAGLATSNDGTNWTAIALPFGIAIPNGAGAINQMTYGNGQYVTIAGSNLLASSPDLVHWTYSTNPPQTSPNAVAFGNGSFVAVGSSNNFASAFLIHSTDGVNWTQSAAPATDDGELYDVVFGNGQFVAAGTAPGRILVSADGSSWAGTPTIANDYLLHVSFANGRFYAGGYSNLGPSSFSALASSADGSAWNPGSDPSLGEFGLFHAVGGNGLILGVALGDPLTISTDGANFVTFTVNGISNGTPAIAFGNGVFADSLLQVSQDGTNWSASAVPPTTNPPVYVVSDLFTGTNGYTAFTLLDGDPLLVSPNGLQFTLTTNDTPTFNRAIHANGLYLAVGDSGVLGLSTNGLDWASRNSAVANNLYDVAYGNSTWVAVGDGGNVTTSPTGNAWTLRGSGTIRSLYGIVYGDNQFVTVGADGTVLSSYDGIAWTAQFSETLDNLNGIVFANGQFVAVGATGTVVTSPDGVNWTSQTSGVQAGLTAIAFGEGTYCAVGNAGGTNLVLTSTNGVSWIQHNSAALQLLTGDPAGVRFLNGTFWVFSDTYLLQSGPVTPVQLQLNLASNIPQISVQASSNLLLELQSAGAVTGPWQNLGLFTNPPTGNFMFLDSSVSGQPQRFYRAAAP